MTDEELLTNDEELLTNKSMMDVTWEQVPAQGYWRWGSKGCNSHDGQITKSKFYSDSRTIKKVFIYILHIFFPDTVAVKWNNVLPSRAADFEEPLLVSM